MTKTRQRKISRFVGWMFVCVGVFVPLIIFLVAGLSYWQMFSTVLIMGAGALTVMVLLVGSTMVSDNKEPNDD